MGAVCARPQSIDVAQSLAGQAGELRDVAPGKKAGKPLTALGDHDELESETADVMSPSRKDQGPPSTQCSISEIGSIPNLQGPGVDGNPAHSPASPSSSHAGSPYDAHMPPSLPQTHTPTKHKQLPPIYEMQEDPSGGDAQQQRASGSGWYQPAPLPSSSTSSSPYADRNRSKRESDSELVEAALAGRLSITSGSRDASFHGGTRAADPGSSAAVAANRAQLEGAVAALAAGAAGSRPSGLVSPFKRPSDADSLTSESMLVITQQVDEAMKELMGPGPTSGSTMGDAPVDAAEGQGNGAQQSTGDATVQQHAIGHDPRQPGGLIAAAAVGAPGSGIASSTAPLSPSPPAAAGAPAAAAAVLQEAHRAATKLPALQYPPVPPAAATGADDASAVAAPQPTDHPGAASTGGNPQQHPSPQADRQGAAAAGVADEAAADAASVASSGSEAAPVAGPGPHASRVPARAAAVAGIGAAAASSSKAIPAGRAAAAPAEAERVVAAQAKVPAAANTEPAAATQPASAQRSSSTQRASSSQGHRRTGSSGSSTSGPAAAAAGSAAARAKRPSRLGGAAGPGHVRSPSISQLADMSVGAGISGDVLGLPVSRYPSKRPSGAGDGAPWQQQPQLQQQQQRHSRDVQRPRQQQQQHRQQGMPDDKALSAAAAVAAAAVLRSAEQWQAEASYQSSQADESELLELSASLPPSNFGTRQPSRVMDVREVLEHQHQLFGGMDAQAAAAAVERLLRAQAQISGDGGGSLQPQASCSSISSSISTASHLQPQPSQPQLQRPSYSGSNWGMYPGGGAPMHGGGPYAYAHGPHGYAHGHPASASSSGRDVHQGQGASRVSSAASEHAPASATGGRWSRSDSNRSSHLSVDVSQRAFGGAGGGYGHAPLQAHHEVDEEGLDSTPGSPSKIKQQQLPASGGSSLKRAAAPAAASKADLDWGSGANAAGPGADASAAAGAAATAVPVTVGSPSQAVAESVMGLLGSDGEQLPGGCSGPASGSSIRSGSPLQASALLSLAADGAATAAAGAATAAAGDDGTCAGPSGSGDANGNGGLAANQAAAGSPSRNLGSTSGAGAPLSATRASLHHMTRPRQQQQQPAGMASLGNASQGRRLLTTGEFEMTQTSNADTEDTEARFLSIQSRLARKGMGESGYYNPYNATSSTESDFHVPGFETLTRMQNMLPPSRLAALGSGELGEEEGPAAHTHDGGGDHHDRDFNPHDGLAALAAAGGVFAAAGPAAVSLNNSLNATAGAASGGRCRQARDSPLSQSLSAPPSTAAALQALPPSLATTRKARASSGGGGAEPLGGSSGRSSSGANRSFGFAPPVPLSPRAHTPGMAARTAAADGGNSAADAAGPLGSLAQQHGRRHTSQGEVELPEEESTLEAAAALLFAEESELLGAHGVGGPFGQVQVRPVPPLSPGATSSYCHVSTTSMSVPPLSPVPILLP